MQNSKYNRSLNLNAILVIYSLLNLFPSANWQGYGNVSGSNLTDIWSFINVNIQNTTFVGTNTAYDDFNSRFSNYLNALWDPAWNIITIKTQASIDSVLYGYAFRNHWIWYNGYVVQGNVLNFVIWKDYNCKGWMTIGESITSSTFTTSQKLAISNTINLVANNSDIWAAAKKISDEIVKTSAFVGKDVAFSIISTAMYDNTYLYGRVCAAKCSKVGNQAKQLKFFIIQMR